MKNVPLTAVAALAALCCPLMSAFAGEIQPAAPQSKPIAISTPASTAVDTTMSNHTAPPASAAQRLDAGSAPSTPTSSPPPAAAPPAPDLSACTGLVVDASAFSSIQRSPAPAIYGPDGALIYPDRSHVPTPDQVQDESIVRYYRSMDDAKAGVGGSTPLVIVPVSVVGPAKDSVTLSAADAASFKALDARIHFTDTWKVGFLVPSNQ